MKNVPIFKPNRRQFLSGIVPACALACFGAREAFALGAPLPLPQEAMHKFDKEVDRKITNRMLYALRYRELIEVLRSFEKEMGKDKLVELLRKTTRQRLLQVGKQHAQGSPDNSFKTYVNTFRNPLYKDALTMKIVEDTDKVFEVKVTECIWATTFLQAKAGDLGHAVVCYGDYAWAEGFNPKIRMVRNKTLMQGHPCCNHRYLWEG